MKVMDEFYWEVLFSKAVPILDYLLFTLSLITKFGQQPKLKNICVARFHLCLFV